jgi:ribose 5-phosphate isomerase B
MKSTIHLAADHAGFELKNAVREWLMSEGCAVEDHGSHAFDAGDDFPDFIQHAARAVSVKPKRDKGIIFGGSGQGEAILANRFPGVRAAVYYGGPDEIVTLSREHNDANVLSIGARFVDENKAKEMIWKWLHTEPLTDKKYARRNTKISDVVRKISDVLAKDIQ